MSKSVYRRAAEIVDDSAHGCCVALQLARYGRDAARDDTAPEVKLLCRVFREVDTAYWWGWTEEDRTARVIALLLMDEMEKDEAA